MSGVTRGLLLGAITVAIGACSDGSRLEADVVPDAWLETWDAPRDTTDDQAGTTSADASAPPEVDAGPITGGVCGEALRVLRVEPWPGGGVGVAVELAAGDGPGAGAVARLADAPAAIASAWQPTGVTGLALTDEARREDALSFLDALPEGEVVVVWAGATLAAEATTDRVHARARIAAAPVTGTPDWSALTSALAALGGPTGPLARTLVVAGEAPVMIAGPVRMVALAPDLAPHLVARRAGLARVGACPGLAAGATVTVDVDGVVCEVAMPAPEPHLAGLACDPAAIAADAFPYGTRVDIVMDAAEVAVWEARKLARSKEDFTGRVRLGAGEPLPATLHFRGQTSMDCERKSYNVDLTGPDARRLAPGVASDELYLVSMCKDDGHYNQLLGDRLAAQIGAFPLGFRVVRLFVNDLDQGLYLLLEDPLEGLRADATALAAVIRRRLDQDGNSPDVEHTIHDDAWAMAAYDAMVASAGDGAEALARHLDLDGYLRWMALSVMLHNGDYVDEVLFHGALEAGQAHPWFRVMGWDPDDLWSPCHRNGVAAIPDPHGILYCAEANIDHVLFADPVIYERFVDHLDDLLLAYPMERMAAEMAVVRDMLFPLMVEDATALAMPELHANYPESVTAEGWKATVEGKMNRDLDRHAAWRDELLGKIAAYRGGP
ncbi:MAG: CotH kinase family protein [Deltaproteobacteria bacterium]|nr:CotH kinase family protein [Deltaproteobacteria bacterium]